MITWPEMEAHIRDNRSAINKNIKGLYADNKVQRMLRRGRTLWKVGGVL